jgi:hypothetical protein
MFKKSYAKLVGAATAATTVLSLATSAFAQDTGGTAKSLGLSLPTTTGIGFNSIPEALQQVLNLVFFFALVLVLIYLIWGGIQWITAGGDKQGTEAARGKITGAIVGIIIVATAFAIYRLLLNFIPGANSLQ